MARFYNEYRSKELLGEFGLPTGESSLANSPEEAEKAADKYGCPVAMKIVSDQIIHKTEAGGIELGVEGRRQVGEAYSRLVANATAYDSSAVIDGVLVAPMVPAGTECIIGGMRDKQFGPIVMFGLGGVFTEVFKDVKFRMAPIDRKEALRVIRSIRGFPLLNGARGRTKANLDELADVLVGVSQYLDANPDVQEIDLNPVVCYDDKVQILDASIGIME